MMATETTTVGKFVVNKQLALCYAIGTSATVFLVGILHGFFERPRHLRMLDIARENEIFLIANAFATPAALTSRTTMAKETLFASSKRAVID